ncbi:hypothetical protein SAMN05444161_8289 [Rhizobiales bacterium GAS191]|nr:hypothetical protein SAMN05444161_8289 [Rhizobiales bacterium GAS191]
MLEKGQGNTPEMPGVSGASIWELDEPSLGEFWAPERFTKAIAIQASYIHSKYLRAKSWWAVALSLAKIDEELRVAILESTGVRAGDP